MRNAAIPDTERQRINEKMKFQTNHCDLLSLPKSKHVREKYEISQERLNEQGWMYTSKKGGMQEKNTSPLPTFRKPNLPNTSRFGNRKQDKKAIASYSHRIHGVEDEPFTLS